MEQIETVVKLLLDAAAANDQLEGFAGRVRALARELSASPIQIPLTIKDQIDRAALAAKSEKLALDIGIKFNQSQVDAALSTLQQMVSAKPLVVPVTFQAMGPMPGAGGGTAPAGGAAPAGAGAGGKGFLSGLASRRGAGAIAATYFAFNQLAGEVGKETDGWKANIENDPTRVGGIDAAEMLKRRRAGIEASHGNDLRGWANYLYDKTGITHAIGMETYDEKAKELNEAEATQRHQDVVQQRTAKEIQMQAGVRQEQEGIDNEGQSLVGSSFDRARTSVAQALKQHEKDADKIVNNWQDYYNSFAEAVTASDKIRSGAKANAALQNAQIAADEKAHERGNKYDAATAQQEVVEIHRQASGDIIGAKYQTERDAVDQNIGKLRNSMVDTMSNPSASQSDKDTAASVFQSAKEKRDDQMKTIGDAEANERKELEQETAAQIQMIQDRAQERRLQSEGRFHEASVFSQKAAIDRQVQGVKDLYSRTIDETTKGEIAKRLAVATQDAQAEKDAIDAEEKRRRMEEAAGFIEGTARAKELGTPLDFAQQSKDLASKWKDRISKIDPGDTETVKAAEADRDAEIDALKQKRDRSLARLRIQATEDDLRRGGNGAMAEAYELEDDTEDQLKQAGGDEDMKKAIRTRAASKARLMAQGEIQGGEFSSVGDYLDSLQQSVTGGAGDAMNALSDFAKGEDAANTAATPAQANGIDEQTASMFKDAVDKLSTANVMVLDNN